MQKENKKSYKKYIIPILLILNLLLTAYTLINVAVVNRKSTATDFYMMQRFYFDENKANIKNPSTGDDMYNFINKYEKNVSLKNFILYPILKSTVDDFKL